MHHTAPSELLGEGLIVPRPMEACDIPAGLALCRASGWNQTIAEWELFLRSAPEKCFVAQHNGRVVGTVTAIDYGGRASWIAMVLVDADMRRRGIGALLLRTAVDALAGCRCIKLDATPAGKKVYDRLGFVDEYRLSRMATPALATCGMAASGCRPMLLSDLDAVVALDAKAFGVPRGEVIRGLYAMAPEYAMAAEDDRSTLTGFVLGRHGVNFEQIGPITAAKRETAQALASAVFARLAGRAVLLDTTLHDEAWCAWLAQWGFCEQRPFVRMVRGPNDFPAIPAHCFAISGPEFG